MRKVLELLALALALLPPSCGCVTVAPRELVLTVGSVTDANVTLTSANVTGQTVVRLRVADEAVATLAANSSQRLVEFAANLSAASAASSSSSAVLLVSLRGVKFGWTDLVIGVEGDVKETRVSLTALMPSTGWDWAFRICVILLVASAVLCMGATIELRVVRSLLRRPKAVAMGWVCQFLLLPHIGLAVGWLLFESVRQMRYASSLGFGLLVTGCSSGGGASNLWTHLLDGDLNLSMTMTFISQVCAFFMMPLWLFAYSRLYLDPQSVRVPYDQVAYTLLQLTVPMAVGVLIRWKLPRVARVLEKAIRPVAGIFIVFVIAAGIGLYRHLLEILVLYPVMIPVVCLLPWLGFLLSYAVVRVFKFPAEQATAIALECGIQNTGVPIQLLLFSMPEPYGDVAMIVPIVVAIATPLPLCLLLLWLMARRRIRGRKKKTAELQDVSKENQDVSKENQDVSKENQDVSKEECEVQAASSWL